MKLFLYVLLIFTLVSCNEDQKQVQKEGAPETKSEESNDPQPKTISQKEVSRIAMVEAKQFLTLATEQAPDANLKTANDLYSEAESLFDNGNYKEAQKKAVEVRHALEKVLIDAKNNG